MKTIFFLIFAFLSTIGFSQKSESGFKSGIIGGLVVSQVDGDEWGGYHKIGLQVGLQSRFILRDKWALAIELKYIQKGSVHTDKEDPYSYFRIKLDYIEIPILLNYQINEHFIFGAGFSFGQLINAQIDDANGNISGASRNYKNIDFNILGQVKYLLNEHFSVDIKMAYSIFYITNQSPRQFNNLVSLGFAYEM